MAKDKIPATLAIRFLRKHKVKFKLHPYRYEEKGGTETASRQLGMDHHLIIKTLVMEDDKKAPLIILMHGDRQVSTKALARAVGARSITPCDPLDAHKHTGYVVGGTSPFGTRKPLPIYVEASVLGLPKIVVNAGRRGLLVEMNPEDMEKILKPLPVYVAR